METKKLYHFSSLSLSLRIKLSAHKQNDESLYNVLTRALVSIVTSML